MNIELNDIEVKLLLNNLSDPTVDICEGCPLFGQSSCEQNCPADKICQKINGGK